MNKINCEPMRLISEGTLTRYYCYLQVNNLIKDLPIVVEQHRIHHEQHKTTKNHLVYEIRLDRYKNAAYCTLGCNNGNPLVDKLRDIGYTRECCLGASDIMKCGLGIRNLLGTPEQLIIDGHFTHHIENHKVVGIQYPDSLPGAIYSIYADGKCGGECIGAAPVRFRPEFVRPEDREIKCRVTDDTNILCRFECGMIIPKYMKENDVKKAINMHINHHKNNHMPQPYILVNPYYKCNCLSVSNTKKEISRKLIL